MARAASRVRPLQTSSLLEPAACRSITWAGGSSCMATSSLGRCRAAGSGPVRGSVVWPGGGAVVAGWQRGGRAGAWGVRALFGGRVVHYAPGMRFRVLGPLEVEADDGPVVLGGPKERLLLALLLTRPNQVVSVEALIRGLWGEQPPPTAAKTLQSHVKRLRRALEPGRARGAAGQVLVTRQPGYLLRVAPGALDATRFEELTAQARRALAEGTAEAAASMLREALGLWRGQAFEEFLDSDFGAAESRPPGRAAAGRAGGSDRGRPAAGPAPGAGGRAGGAGPRAAAAGAAVGPAAAGVVPGRVGRPMRCWPTSGPGRSWSRSSASTRGRSCAGCTRRSWPRTPGWTCRRRLRAAPSPGAAGGAAAGGAAICRAGRPSWPGCGPPGHGPRTAEAGWSWWPAGRAWARPGWPPSSPGRSTTRAAGCCTAAAMPEADDPLQPFAQALTGVGASVQDAAGARCRAVPGSPRSGARRPAGRPVRPSGAADPGRPAPGSGAGAGGTGWTCGRGRHAAAAGARRLPRRGSYARACCGWSERLDPGGAAHRRLGPFGQDEVAQVLSLYESEQAARAAAGTVLDAHRRRAAAGPPGGKRLGAGAGGPPG